MNKIYRMICDENWPELLKLDELNRELAAGRVLHGFKALQPSWPPTFKRHRHVGINRCMYDRDGASPGDPVWDIAYHDCLPLGSKSAKTADANSNAVNDYDTFSGSNPNADTTLVNMDVSLAENMSDIAYNSITNFYHKKRIPSYTDRILYKSWDSYAANLVTNRFESVEEVLSSDHKPVRASFTLSTTFGLKSINVFYEDKGRQRFFGGRSPEPLPMTTAPVTSPSKGIRNSMVGNRQTSAGSVNGGGSVNSDRSSVITAKYQQMAVHNLISTDASFATLESSIESYHAKVFSKIRFEFYNIHCINLAEMDSSLSGGKSDPYIILSADPTVLGCNPRHEKDDSILNSCACIGYSSRVHEVVSPVVYHNLNPVWEDHLNLTILSFDVQGLMDNLNFVVAVWDHDRFNEDDVIGTCVISFKEMFPSLTKARAEDRKFYFDKPLVNKGKLIALKTSCCVADDVGCLGIVMGRIKGAVRVPDRTLEYYTQENAACYMQAMAIDEAHGTHRHRPPMKQGSFGSISSPSPRGGGGDMHRDMYRSPSNATKDSLASDQGSKCVVM
jgi:hypothetical protein